MSRLVPAFVASEVSPAAGTVALAAAYGMERPISLRSLLSTIALYTDRSLLRSCRVIRFSPKNGVQALADLYGVAGMISLRELLDDVWTKSSLAKIKRFFVLVLENRSFDHLLGFSGISGVDSQTGVERSIDGLTGTESNLDSNGNAHSVSQPGWLRFPWDPQHEHPHVMRQICGTTEGCDTPTMTGFVRDFETVDSGSGNPRPSKAGDIMSCMSPDQMPILVKLASEFAVVDRFFSSLPGSTWPNRFFIHAATAGGYDYDPPSKGFHEVFDGYDFDRGNIFERLDAKDIPWLVYSDSFWPDTWAIADVHFSDMLELYPFFALNLQDKTITPIGEIDQKFEFQYIFLEGDNDTGGDEPTDMHAPGHLWSGEQLIKDIYEAIRTSKYWEESALIITFDEHGGFFDHVPPPSAVPPGDENITTPKYGFDFTRFGVRVPAIVISPWVPKNTVIGGPRAADLYDHTSILATLEKRFDLASLTDRDASAQNFKHVFRLRSARTDTPKTLPAIADFDENQSTEPSKSVKSFRTHATADLHFLPTWLRRHVTLGVMTELRRTPEAERTAVLSRLDAAHTVGAVLDLLDELGQRPPRRRTHAERRAVREAYRRSRGRKPVHK